MTSISDYPSNALKQTLKQLRAYPFLAAAANHLKANIDAINAELADIIVAEIPAFTESHNPDVLPDMALHGPQHTDEIIRLLMGGQTGQFGFVQEHAQKSAEQRFPLESILHAYRCAHRVFYHWIRESVLAVVSSADDAQQAVTTVAEFAIDYTDAISTVATSAYLSQTRLLADIAGDQRAELLTILLDGYDESDGRVTKILRAGAYLDQRQSFCVALARSVDPSEMLNPARARRLVDAIDIALRHFSPRRIIDIRDNKVTIVFSDARRISGWTATNTALAKRVSAELTTIGNSVLIGVSNDAPSTSQIPGAYREAILALELSDVTQRVVQLSELPIQRLLMYLAGDEFHRVLPAWSNRFFQIDHKQGGALVATLRAYANAELLSLHPNTIYARLQKVLDITGLDAKNFHSLNELLIVADCNIKPKPGKGV
jgi:hypothetical protein